LQNFEQQQKHSAGGEYRESGRSVAYVLSWTLSLVSARAMNLILSGRLLEALELGLSNRVVSIGTGQFHFFFKRHLHSKYLFRPKYSLLREGFIKRKRNTRHVQNGLIHQENQ
jgi:hypothetical protein